MQNSNSHFAIAPGSHALASRPFLGSQVVDGLLIAQNYNRDDPSPRFQEFSEAYFKRFQRAPGYSAVSAYDAATVVLTALKNRQPGETPDYPQIPLVRLFYPHQTVNPLISRSWGSLGRDGVSSDNPNSCLGLKPDSAR